MYIDVQGSPDALEELEKFIGENGLQIPGYQTDSSNDFGSSDEDKSEDPDLSDLAANAGGAASFSDGVANFQMKREYTLTLYAILGVAILTFTYLILAEWYKRWNEEKLILTIGPIIKEPQATYKFLEERKLRQPFIPEEPDGLFEEESDPSVSESDITNDEIFRRNLLRVTSMASLEHVSLTDDEDIVDEREPLVTLTSLKRELMIPWDPTKTDTSESLKTSKSSSKMDLQKMKRDLSIPWEPKNADTDDESFTRSEIPDKVDMRAKMNNGLSIPWDPQDCETDDDSFTNGAVSQKEPSPDTDDDSFTDNSEDAVE